jgi:putative membrane protein
MLSAKYPEKKLNFDSSSVLRSSADSPSAGSKRWVRLLFTLTGLVLLAVLFRQVGIGEVSDHLRHLGWLSPLLLLPYGVGAVFDCKGWDCALKTFEEAVPLHRLYLARLPGEAVNNLTPAGAVGGEPIKVYMLKTLGVPTDRALASVVIAKTAITAGQIIFILIGVPFFLHHLGLLRQGGIILLPLLGLAYLFVRLLIRLQTRGLLTLGVGRLKRVLPRLERWEKKAQSIDAYLLEFYSTNPRAFLASTFYHLIGWLVGVVEVALALSLLGVSFRPADALIIESMLQPLAAAALLIPGALGVQEVGGVFLCRLLGIDEAAGLALMVIKRARQTVYTLIGLLLLTRLGGASKSAEL